MNENVKREMLQSQLVEIDKRRAELEVLLKVADPRSYRHQELAHELRHLDALRADITRPAPDPAIKEAHRQALSAQAQRMRDRHQPTKTRPDVIAERQLKRRQLIDALEAREKAGIEAAARQFETQGDHRQARIWRESAWRVRARLEGQIP